MKHDPNPSAPPNEMNFNLNPFSWKSMQLTAPRFTDNVQRVCHDTLPELISVSLDA